jgi:hypothetical protein
MNKATVAAPGEEALPDGSIRVRLSRAIIVPPPKGETGNRPTEHLTFREPTAEDIEIAGCPVTIDADHRGEPKVVFEERKMNAMLARLSGVPTPFILKMRASDWTNCAWGIAPFFVPGVRT